MNTTFEAVVRRVARHLDSSAQFLDTTLLPRDTQLPGLDRVKGPQNSRGGKHTGSDFSTGAFDPKQSYVSSIVPAALQEVVTQQSSSTIDKSNLSAQRHTSQALSPARSAGLSLTGDVNMTGTEASAAVGKSQIDARDATALSVPASTACRAMSLGTALDAMFDGHMKVVLRIISQFAEQSDARREMLLEVKRSLLSPGPKVEEAVEAKREELEQQRKAALKTERAELMREVAALRAEISRLQNVAHYGTGTSGSSGGSGGGGGLNATAPTPRPAPSGGGGVDGAAMSMTQPPSPSRTAVGNPFSDSKDKAGLLAPPSSLGGDGVGGSGARASSSGARRVSSSPRASHQPQASPRASHQPNSGALLPTPQAGGSSHAGPVMGALEPDAQPCGHVTFVVAMDVANAASWPLQDVAAAKRASIALFDSSPPPETQHDKSREGQSSRPGTGAGTEVDPVRRRSSSSRFRAAAVAARLSVGHDDSAQRSASDRPTSSAGVSGRPRSSNNARRVDTPMAQWQRIVADTASRFRSEWIEVHMGTLCVAAFTTCSAATDFAATCVTQARALSVNAAVQAAVHRVFGRLPNPWTVPQPSGVVAAAAGVAETLDLLHALVVSTASAEASVLPESTASSSTATASPPRSKPPRPTFGAGSDDSDADAPSRTDTAPPPLYHRLEAIARQLRRAQSGSAWPAVISTNRPPIGTTEPWTARSWRPTLVALSAPPLPLQPKATRHCVWLYAHRVSKISIGTLETPVVNTDGSVTTTGAATETAGALSAASGVARVAAALRVVAPAPSVLHSLRPLPLPGLLPGAVLLGVRIDSFSVAFERSPEVALQHAADVAAVLRRIVAQRSGDDGITRALAFDEDDGGVPHSRLTAAAAEVLDTHMAVDGHRQWRFLATFAKATDAAAVVAEAMDEIEQNAWLWDPTCAPTMGAPLTVSGALVALGNVAAPDSAAAAQKMVPGNNSTVLLSGDRTIDGFLSSAGGAASVAKAGGRQNAVGVEKHPVYALVHVPVVAFGKGSDDVDGAGRKTLTRSRSRVGFTHDNDMATASAVAASSSTLLKRRFENSANTSLLDQSATLADLSTSGNSGAGRRTSLNDFTAGVGSAAEAVVAAAAGATGQFAPQRLIGTDVTIAPGHAAAIQLREVLAMAKQSEVLASHDVMDLLDAAHPAAARLRRVREGTVSGTVAPPSTKTTKSDASMTLGSQVIKGSSSQIDRSGRHDSPKRTRGRDNGPLSPTKGPAASFMSAKGSDSAAFEAVGVDQDSTKSMFSVLRPAPSISTLLEDPFEHLRTAARRSTVVSLAPVALTLADAGSRKTPPQSGGATPLEQSPIHAPPSLHMSPLNPGFGSRTTSPSRRQVLDGVVPPGGPTVVKTAQALLDAAADPSNARGQSPVLLSNRQSPQRLATPPRQCASPTMGPRCGTPASLALASLDMTLVSNGGPVPSLDALGEVQARCVSAAPAGLQEHLTGLGEHGLYCSHLRHKANVAANALPATPSRGSPARGFGAPPTPPSPFAVSPAMSTSATAMFGQHVTLSRDRSRSEGKTVAPGGGVAIKGTVHCVVAALDSVQWAKEIDAAAAVEIIAVFEATAAFLIEEYSAAVLGYDRGDAQLVCVFRSAAEAVGFASDLHVALHAAPWSDAVLRFKDFAAVEIHGHVVVRGPRPRVGVASAPDWRAVLCAMELAEGAGEGETLLAKPTAVAAYAEPQWRAVLEPVEREAAKRITTGRPFISAFAGTALPESYNWTVSAPTGDAVMNAAAPNSKSTRGARGARTPSPAPNRTFQTSPSDVSVTPSVRGASRSAPGLTPARGGSSRNVKKAGRSSSRKSLAVVARKDRSSAAADDGDDQVEAIAPSRVYRLHPPGFHHRRRVIEPGPTAAAVLADLAATDCHKGMSTMAAAEGTSGTSSRSPQEGRLIRKLLAAQCINAVPSDQALQSALDVSKASEDQEGVIDASAKQSVSAAAKALKDQHAAFRAVAAALAPTVLKSSEAAALLGRIRRGQWVTAEVLPGFLASRRELAGLVPFESPLSFAVVGHTAVDTPGDAAEGFPEVEVTFERYCELRSSFDMVALRFNGKSATNAAVDGDAVWRPLLPPAGCRMLHDHVARRWSEFMPPSVAEFADDGDVDYVFSASLARSAAASALNAAVAAAKDRQPASGGRPGDVMSLAASSVHLSGSLALNDPTAFPFEDYFGAPPHRLVAALSDDDTERAVAACLSNAHRAQPPQTPDARGGPPSPNRRTATAQRSMARAGRSGRQGMPSSHGKDATETAPYTPGPLPVVRVSRSVTNRSGRLFSFAELLLLYCPATSATALGEFEQRWKEREVQRKVNAIEKADKAEAKRKEKREQALRKIERAKERAEKRARSEECPSSEPSSSSSEEAEPFPESELQLPAVSSGAGTPAQRRATKVGSFGKLPLQRHDSATPSSTAGGRSPSATPLQRQRSGRGSLRRQRSTPRLSPVALASPLGSVVNGTSPRPTIETPRSTTTAGLRSPAGNLSPTRRRKGAGEDHGPPLLPEGCIAVRTEVFGEFVKGSLEAVQNAETQCRNALLSFAIERGRVMAATSAAAMHELCCPAFGAPTVSLQAFQVERARLHKIIASLHFGLQKVKVLADGYQALGIAAATPPTPPDPAPSTSGPKRFGKRKETTVVAPPPPTHQPSGAPLPELPPLASPQEHLAFARDQSKALRVKADALLAVVAGGVRDATLDPYTSTSDQATKLTKLTAVELVAGETPKKSQPRRTPPRRPSPSPASALQGYSAFSGDAATSKPRFAANLSLGPDDATTATLDESDPSSPQRPRQGSTRSAVEDVAPLGVSFLQRVTSLSLTDPSGTRAVSKPRDSVSEGARRGSERPRTASPGSDDPLSCKDKPLHLPGFEVATVVSRHDSIDTTAANHSQSPPPASRNESPPPKPNTLSGGGAGRSTAASSTAAATSALLGGGATAALGSGVAMKDLGAFADAVTQVAASPYLDTVPAEVLAVASVVTLGDIVAALVSLTVHRTKGAVRSIPKPKPSYLGPRDRQSTVKKETPTPLGASVRESSNDDQSAAVLTPALAADEPMVGWATDEPPPTQPQGPSPKTTDAKPFSFGTSHRGRTGGERHVNDNGVWTDDPSAGDMSVPASLAYGGSPTIQRGVGAPRAATPSAGLPAMPGIDYMQRPRPASAARRVKELTGEMATAQRKVDMVREMATKRK